MAVNDEEKYEAAEKFVGWLEQRIVTAGRGDADTSLEVEPSGKYWLGRLAPEEDVVARGLGERGERLDPCAIGMRLKPSRPGPWKLKVAVSACAWFRDTNRLWYKASPVETTLAIEVAPGKAEQAWGREELLAKFAEATGIEALTAEVRVEVSTTSDGKTELTLILVNVSPKSHPQLDTNLYECSFKVSSLPIEPFLLEALPDSFRYDRRVEAYGINCGVKRTPEGGFVTTDVVETDKYRPKYWSVTDAEPDFRFASLYGSPLPIAKRLLDVLGRWGEAAWGEATLEVRRRQEHWSDTMFASACQAASEFRDEYTRIALGVALLEQDETLLRAFRLMNRAMLLSTEGRGYDRWRPFQFGFLLANLACIVAPSEESEIVDIVWFATGGGKTETYLGLLITAALYDRLTGKLGGITAWSRFPLRMLSLQQTQRFADAMAGAERVRCEEGVAGHPFSVGFLVGRSSTPNTLQPDAKPGSPDPDDEEMPRRYQVLLHCPFCHEKSLAMDFDRLHWRLVHRCTNDACSWPEEALPFFIVDDEIYRFLPTVVVGTLDKAASIAMQAAMRGLVGPPLGMCSADGHGYTYALRSTRPQGCLVPGCRAKTQPLDIEANRYGPSFRLQDELHLLRDSLGAVDSHYEALYDQLQMALCGSKPKILASSATLTGYEKQADVLYRRGARVFPQQGPSVSEGFWTSDSEDLMRRFVAVAPRGVTLEFTLDRLLTETQRAIRELVERPEQVCTQIGVDPALAPFLVSHYGTNVVYGNTLRDLDAAMRSAETQVRVESMLNTASLTGRTDFEEVRQTLERLEHPEDSFEDRLHVIAASSMMSHGVDIDRLNIMGILGIPLTTAEFIQATSRVGRRWPGLVFVVHKIGRERDASVYRSFGKFVEQGDRFVEPIPVTRRSRRVLEKTIAGLELARILIIHEPMSKNALTTVGRLRGFMNTNGVDEPSEITAMIRTLGMDEPLDEPMKLDIAAWFARFFRNLRDPGGTFKFPADLSPSGKPMLSLRDVEEQAPIHGSRIS
jgi:hypothetical protein